MGLREAKKRETRERMVEVARELFAERGFDAVAVSEIADQARVSLKTFYNYFPSKAALLDEIALELVVATTEHLEGSLAGPETARSAIERIAAAFGRSIARAPDFNAAIFQRSGLFRAEGELRDVELRMYDALAALIRRDQASGRLRDDVDPLALAEVLVAAWMLISLNWLARWWKSRGNLAERLRSATGVVFEGVER